MSSYWRGILAKEKTMTFAYRSTYHFFYATYTLPTLRLKLWPRETVYVYFSVYSVEFTVGIVRGVASASCSTEQHSILSTVVLNFKVGILFMSQRGGGSL